MKLGLLDSSDFTAEASRICRTVLPSGVRILSEEIPGAPSVAIAASVAVGSRDELPGTFGSTHFLEHLLFKGTSRRNAKDISVAFDSVGGSSNAATAKEYTSYYARVMNSALPLALDVILDMFTSAKIGQHDFDVERTVILEELAMGAAGEGHGSEARKLMTRAVEIWTGLKGSERAAKARRKLAALS